MTYDVKYIDLPVEIYWIEIKLTEKVLILMNKNTQE